MAGDWIKVDCTTPDKPEVVAMATFLKIDQDAVVGKCIRLWVWANQQSVDGNALNVTDSFIDRLTYCPGFSLALRHVGWLDGRDSRLSIPNFDRHNGQPAKTRALTKDRVGKTRNASECNAETVTKPLPEKRREEKSNSISASGDDVVIPESMQRPDVLKAAAFWFQHLDVVAPDKVPLSNSPQMQAFWNDAARNGPDKFIRQVEHCSARGWKNLREVDDSKSKGNGKRGYKHTSQSREESNADAFATLYASIGGAESDEPCGTDSAIVLNEKSGATHGAPA
jgi:hypothetical protein